MVARSIAAVPATLALALAFVAPACRDYEDDALVELDAFELRAGAPRVLRWKLCKEGAGTPEAFEAQLDLAIESPGPAAARVEVRAWPSIAAYEAGEEPEPFYVGDVVIDEPDRLRLELRPEGAFEEDGRRCTADRFLRVMLVEGAEVTIDAVVEAQVLDYDDVLDRLILEAELLP